MGNNANLYKTGQKAPVTGNYYFHKYVDGKTSPTPTKEERIIRLTKGEIFPPVRSANKAAWWRG